jgi:ABC-type sugar transport system ATPase subunit
MTGSTVRALLEADGVTRYFSGRRVLGPLDLRVCAGSIHAVLGKNGAGKSTLMKILGGFDRADSGALHLDGAPLSGHGVHSHEAAGIALVPQELTVFPGLSVADQVLLGDRYPRWQGGVIQRRRGELEAAKTLARLHAEIDPACPVEQLTVPQLRTVMIARAIHMDAKVLILDEPTEAFAFPEVQALFEVLRSLRDRGLGIVYVSHRLSEVFSLADTVTVLRDGRAVIDGVDLRETTADRVVSAIVTQEPDDTSRSENHAHAASTARGHGFSASDTTGAQAHSTFVPRDGSTEVELLSGGVVGLAGLVGSGRTSILETMAGLSPGRATRTGVAFLPEDRAQLGLLHGLTVRENITISGPSKFASGWLRVLSRQRERRLCRDVMRRVGMAESTLEDAVDSLSGGNQQKTLLARGLFGGAHLWLLDEPTVGLDVQSRRQVLDLVREVARGSSDDGDVLATESAAVLASSDLDDLIETCDVVYVVSGGAVRERITAPFTEEQLTLLTALA